MTETPKTSPSGIGPSGPLVIVGVCLLVYFMIGRPAGTLNGWGTDFEAAMATARKDHKSVLLAFHSKNCPPCVSMARTVLNEPAVEQRLKDFVPVHVDLFERVDLGTRFNVIGTPTYIVLSPEGKVLAERIGYIPIKDFIAFLSDALNRAKPASVASVP